MQSSLHLYNQGKIILEKRKEKTGCRTKITTDTYINIENITRKACLISLERKFWDVSPFTINDELVMV